MKVYCRSDDCKWFEDRYCTADVITLSEGNECEDYESYLDTAEWRKPFYKRCKCKETKQIYRVLFYGKEIELNGRKFFIESKSNYATVTDAVTGYGCCDRCDLEERFYNILQKIAESNISPLESLPLGEFRERGRIVSVEERKEGEQK